MKISLFYRQLAGFVFTVILGTFLHFLFDLTDQNVIAALFSAVNESIWEHMKLLFYPMFLFALIEYCLFEKNNKQFWCIELMAIILGLVLIPVVYYTYTGILGVSVDWFNITIFFIAAWMSFCLRTKLYRNGFMRMIDSKLAFMLICLIAVAFTVLTFVPPTIPLFADPIGGTYGFQ